MIEDSLKIQLPPGYMGNGTMYQSAGRWRTGNFVRFHEGAVRPIGGWNTLPLTGAPILGIAEHAISWQGQSGTPWMAVGTTNGLYVIDVNNVVYDITPGTIFPAPYNWQLSTYGTILIATNTLLGDQDISAINVYYWDTSSTGTLAAPAWTTANGPRGVYATFTTPELFLVTLRGEDPSGFPARGGIGTAYSEHRVYWPTQETLPAIDGGADFLAKTTNTEGEFDLQTKGRMMAGIGSKGESLIFTDIDVWKMIFIGGALVYSFVQAGINCGTVSKRAHVALNQGIFWMGRGKFFMYDGFVRSLPCEVSDAVFGDFNQQTAYNVWAVANPEFNEVTWFYPAAGSQYPDSYVTYNFAEQHWVTGKLTRSAGVQQRFTQDIIDPPIPVWFNNAQPFEHEQGVLHDSVAYLESGPVELGEGDQLMRVQNVVPDDKNVGDVQLRLFTAMAPDDVEKLRGPYGLTALTNVRWTARQIRVRFEETSNGDDWRVGYIRLGVRAVERRGPGAGVPADLTPASLEILPSSITLTDGATYTFESIVRNAEGAVLDILPDTWTSDNVQVPVNNHGTVTALATPETAHIQAFITSPPLSSNIATVTVNGDNTPASIVVTPGAVTVIASSTPATLTAKVYNREGLLLPLATIDTWTTSDVTKVTITPSGGQNLTASAAGVANGTSNVQAKITTGVTTPVLSNIVVVTVTDPYYTHEFDASGEFNVTTLGTGVVDRVLLVGGGGSGASIAGTGVGGGGGGAGAVREFDGVGVNLGNNPVNVGAGGAGVVANDVFTVEDGLGGSPTNFQGSGALIQANGGGAGSASGNGGATDGASNAAGSGGGGRGAAGSGSGGAGTPPYGHAGGAGNSTIGGGGGGFGSAGVVGAGGANATNDILGSANYYGAGGQPSSAISFTGVTQPSVPGANAAANHGDGGGAAQGGYEITDFEGDSFPEGSVSGTGGSGVCIIRYKVSTGIVATGGTKILHS